MITTATAGRWHRRRCAVGGVASWAGGWRRSARRLGRSRPRSARSRPAACAARSRSCSFCRALLSRQRRSSRRGAPGREVFGQVAPGAPGPVHVQDRVHDHPAGVYQRPAAPARPGTSGSSTAHSASDRSEGYRRPGRSGRVMWARAGPVLFVTKQDHGARAPHIPERHAGPVTSPTAAHTAYQTVTQRSNNSPIGCLINIAIPLDRSHRA